MPGPIKVMEPYQRARAIRELVVLLTKWIPPSPAASPDRALDVVETGLRTMLPGCRVRVQVERITDGAGTAPVLAAPAVSHGGPGAS